MVATMAGLKSKAKADHHRKKEKCSTNLWNMPSPTFLLLSLSIFVKVSILFQFAAIAFLFYSLFSLSRFRLPSLSLCSSVFLSTFNFSLWLIWKTKCLYKHWTVIEIVSHWLRDRLLSVAIARLTRTLCSVRFCSHGSNTLNIAYTIWKIGKKKLCLA